MNKIKRYSDISEEIGFKNAIIGGALGVATLLSNPTLSQQVSNDLVYSDSKESNLNIFIQSIVDKKPEIFLTPNDPVTMDTTAPISFLEMKFMEYSIQKNLKLNISDLNKFSHKDSPLKIRYFYIRGLDNLTDIVLIPIFNVTYTEVIRMYGHNVRFCITQMSKTPMVGASIEF